MPARNNFFGDIKHFDWIDGYLDSMKPYIYVREKDSLLIKRPNQSFRLNKSAAAMLRHILYSGGSVRDIVKMKSKDEAAQNELLCFFYNLKTILSGNMIEKSPALETVPFTVPFSGLPVLSEISLTYECNLRCKFCYASCVCTRERKLGDNRETKVMTTDEVISVMKKIRYEAETPSLSFTGGEPTLRTDLIELIKAAKKMGLWVNLITNGTNITKDYAKKLKRSGLDSVQVSLESASPETHDFLTGVLGSFEKTLNGIKYLLKAGMNIHTNTTVCRTNLNQLEKICLLINSLGLKRLSMNLLIPAGRADDNKILSVSYSEIGPHLVRMKSFAKNLGIEFLWYSPTPLCIFNTISNDFGNKGCAACEGLLSVSPAGEVLPCSSYFRPLGSLLENSFETVWNSAESRWFRNKEFASDACRKCESFRVCHSACPLYWKSNGMSELHVRI